MYKVIGGDKQEYGPTSEEEIRQWIGEGRLNGASLLKLESENDWRPLSSFGEFAQALERQRRQFPNAEAPPLIPEPILEARAFAPEFSVVDCLSRGWRLWQDNFLLLSLATMLVWGVGTLLQFLPFLGLLYWFVKGALYGGLFIVALRRLRDEQTTPLEAFGGFGPAFTQLMLAGMATSFLSTLGIIFCIVPGIYLMVAWCLALPIILDQQTDFWSSMERSRKAVGRQWSKFFVLCLIAFLPVILADVYAQTKIGAAMYEAMQPYMPASGAFDFRTAMQHMNQVSLELAKTSMPLLWATKCVLLANLPFGISVLACAYEQLLGKRNDNDSRR